MKQHILAMFMVVGASVSAEAQLTCALNVTPLSSTAFLGRARALWMRVARSPSRVRDRREQISLPASRLARALHSQRQGTGFFRAPKGQERCLCKSSRTQPLRDLGARLPPARRSSFSARATGQCRRPLISAPTSRKEARSPDYIQRSFPSRCVTGRAPGLSRIATPCGPSPLSRHPLPRRRTLPVPHLPAGVRAPSRRPQSLIVFLQLVCPNRSKT